MKNIITAENQELYKKVLDDVFDNFDFEKVKLTMDALEWKWVTSKSENSIPSLDEIKEEAARLMWDCANMDTERLAAGGFVVEKDFSDPDDPWMRLSFEVTDWEAGASEFDE